MAQVERRYDKKHVAQLKLRSFVPANVAGTQDDILKKDLS